MGSRQQVQLLPALLRGCSSAAERSPVERVRTGSNPVIPASRGGCGVNGSIRGSDPRGAGSIPVGHPFAGEGGADFPPGTRFASSRSGLTPLALSPRQRLDDAIRTVSGLPFGGTDCALPMLYALEREREIDTFVIYTDSETWAGGIHPAQALRKYREQSGISASLVVVGMVSNGFSIADPQDQGMLDVVGFDTATPRLISDFARGTL